MSTVFKRAEYITISLSRQAVTPLCRADAAYATWTDAFPFQEVVLHDILPLVRRLPGQDIGAWS
jgi:hypothetical protein